MFLFRIKYEVIALEQHNVRLIKEIHENKQAIHHLKAEWAHLNDPKSLQNFTQKYLPDLSPVKSSQLITFQDMAGSSRNAKTNQAKQLAKGNTQQNALDDYIADLTAGAADGVRA
jgi:hypothetical protein